MIRIETDAGWILIEHPEHARLAGQFGAHWGNAEFPVPEPRAKIMTAVFRHDDAWALRDSNPVLTREGKPSAFSRELVGKYSAFEEIDFADYLAVRERAAEGVAADNPYAAIIISMHTVDLLTRQADLSALSEAERDLHCQFIGRQVRRQSELVELLRGGPDRDEVAPERLQRAFEFLQACDSLSLTACVRYDRPIPLRHAHPRTKGAPVTLECAPLGGDTYRVTPYPFEVDEFNLEVPFRFVQGKAFADQNAFRSAYLATAVVPLKVRVVR